MSLSIVMMLHNLNGGGIQNYVKDLSRYYIEQGHAVYLVCSDSIQDDEGFNVLNIPYNTNKGFNDFCTWLSSLTQKKYKVYAHTFDAYKVIYKIRKKNICMNKYLFNVVHVDYHALYYRWYTPFKNMERTFNYKSFLNHSNVLSVSTGALKALTQLIGVKLAYSKVIGAPVNFKQIKTKANETVTDMLTQPYIVLVSRLAVRKNISMAIKALSLSNCNFPLVIIGKGSELAKLINITEKLQLKNKVIFIGWKNNPFPYIKGAHFLVSTSNVEGFGLTLVEAMGLGVPVISTNARSGPKEILSDQYQDLLVPLNDHIRLSSLFNRLEQLKNEDRFQPEILMNHVKKYSVDRVAEAMIEDIV